MQSLVMSALEKGELKQLILSSFIILEDETSEKQIALVIGIIETGRKRLQRWTDMVNQKFLGYVHDTPSPNQMNITKLTNGGAVTSDTCNGAWKTRHLLKNVIDVTAKA
eukprot:2395486-Ditylum_brightwellii.AAC.1